MSGTYIKVNGEWRLLPQDIKKNGSWEDITNAWIKENGAWTLYRTENVPVEYLVVAGGGGGGGHDTGDPAGGGGGAGGFLTNVYGQDEPGATTNADSPNDAPDNTWDAYTLEVGKEYGIEVGTGGAGGRRGNPGNDSIFATITSIGGGRGGAGKNGQSISQAGGSGGSGGGRGADPNGSGGAGTAYQGKNGGGSNGNRGGGGGGAGEYTSNTGKGGDGLQSNINGTPTYYAGGGGSYDADGGLGGGGDGGKNVAAGVGLDGSGGGGGGKGLQGSGGAGSAGNGAAGGDGVVIFRIPSVYKANFDAGIEFSSNRYDVPNYAVYNVTSGIGSFSIGYFNEFYTENSLFTFGLNNEGQLGDGTTTSNSSLTQISGEWADITNGIDFTVGIKTDGTLWAWGHNNLGQLGTGVVNSPARSTTPVQIGTDTNWQSVKAGNSTNANGHILALKTNGTLWAWGNQNNGQLGNGSSSSASIATPTQIGTDTDWASISAGDRASAAIKTNGDLYTWGRASRGRLGDGTTTEKTTPTFIGSGYSKVSCGEIHSGQVWGFFTIAIKTDGTLWAWGDQNVGQLGDGVTSNTFVSTPKQIGSDTDWDKIATGGGFTLAIKTNKTLWGWGRNNDGQLGDGTKTERTTPTQIGSGNHWKDIDCGERSALMLTDGALWGTGLNNTGQISHLTTDQYYPLQISSSLETAWKKVSMGFRTSAVITGV